MEKGNCESRDCSREGSRGASEQKKVKTQGTWQATAIAQSTTWLLLACRRCLQARSWRRPAVGRRQPIFRSSTTVSLSQFLAYKYSGLPNVGVMLNFPLEKVL